MTTDIENQDPNPVQLCILYVETEGTDFADRLSERAEEQLGYINLAFSKLVLFLTNYNAITEEAELELAGELKCAGRPDLAEVVEHGGFTAAKAEILRELPAKG